MLSDRDRVVLGQIERELSLDDPRLAEELAELRPPSGGWSRRLFVSLLVFGGLLMVAGVLVAQPVLFWLGAIVLSTTGTTRRWWPHRR